MNELIAMIDAKINDLRAALAQNRRPQINRSVQLLERDLLNGNGYQSVWDERLLSKIAHYLSLCYGVEAEHKLNGLREHLTAVRSVHDRLYAVLDAGIELDELLFLHLDTWPRLLKGPIGCGFDNKTKTELHEARSNENIVLGLNAFWAAYFQNLRNKGFGDVVDALAIPVESAIHGYTRAHQWTVNGLFIARQGKGEVRGLKIGAEARPTSDGPGQVNCLNNIGSDMVTAANQALACVRKSWPSARAWDFTWEIEGGEVAFTGDSIGLALTIGILAKVESFDVDAYTAFTGHVEWDTGGVERVEYVNAKLDVARELGIRRVFMPEANINELNGIVGLEVIPVGSVGEARETLRSRSFERVNTPFERLANAKIRELEVELEVQLVQRVDVSQRTETCKRVTFTDHRDQVFVDVFHGNRGLNPVVQKKNTALEQTIQKTVDRVFGSPRRGDHSTSARRSRSEYAVSNPTEQEKVRRYIDGRGDRIFEPEQNCVYRARIVGAGQIVFVRQYTTGKLMVDGPQNSSLFQEVDRTIGAILRALEESPRNDMRKTRLRSQIDEVEALQLGGQWIGTDESGKGDYYGPLVGAAVLVDEKTAELLEELGVKDSKRLSDKRVRDLAGRIGQACGKRAVVVTIPPERYNALYEEFRAEGKKLNTLLAWAHTRALENILTEFPQRRITVLVDKFADESYIHGKLLEKGRQTDLSLIQLPKAEANIAVAAASVIARAQFLYWLERLSKQRGVDLPKGASDPRIVQVGKQIVAHSGESELSKVAKLHFKTTKKILA